MAYRWLSTDLLTGKIIADLPNLEPQYPLKRTISATETCGAVLHLTDQTSAVWQDAIYEGGAALLCYDDDDPSLPIVWGGYVVETSFDSTDDVTISLATYEAVLDRAYVGDVTFGTSLHREDILHSLVGIFNDATGLTLLESYVLSAGPTPVNPIVMQKADNASVKQRMDEVCAQLGGEYTVEWSWTGDRTGVVATLVHGEHIGTPVDSGLDPAVTFEMPGQITAFTQLHSYAPDKAGNKIVAYSAGQTSSVLFADPVLGPPDGRPTWEYRYQPASSISPAAVAQYAAKAVLILAPGARPVTLSVAKARDRGRRFGVEWALGDDIGYRIPPSYVDEQGFVVVFRAFPDGIESVGRVISVEFSDTTITPILADKTIYMGA